MTPRPAGRILAAFAGLAAFPVLLAAPTAGAQDRPPILDVHVHAYGVADLGPPPLAICAPFEGWPTWHQDEGPYGATFMAFSKDPPCANPIWTPESDDALMRETIEVMERHNIVGVLSGTPERVAAWRAAAPGRFIPGLAFDAGTTAITPDSLRALVASGDVAVLGEVLNQYSGVAPDDERMAPYWDLAEELGIPVGLHVGVGPPGTTYLATPHYRARLSSALLLEDVLVAHPDLRVYVMHAGFPLLEDMLATMYAHPQLYVDISIIAYAEPRERFYRYLGRLVEAGYGDRIMWGSDQMVWPGVIEPSLRSIQEAPFLTDAQKRAILYDNAARFLRLTEEERAAHRAM